ncbi:hypothetical protein PsW64_03814 [Pseudovibrio sp. W64]|nr:hypothetical protein PsW64_03814 [Pseudovibrio sp. W64]
MAVHAGTLTAPCGWEEMPTNPGFLRMKSCDRVGTGSGNVNLSELFASGWTGLEIGWPSPQSQGGTSNRARLASYGALALAVLGLIYVLRN